MRICTAKQLPHGGIERNATVLLRYNKISYLYYHKEIHEKNYYYKATVAHLLKKFPALYGA